MLRLNLQCTTAPDVFAPVSIAPKHAPSRSDGQGGDSLLKHLRTSAGLPYDEAVNGVVTEVTF
jgi:hypothetical protein